mgnify:CR=1 FL=1
MNIQVQNLLQFWQTAAKACHFREAIFIPATLMSDWIEKKVRQSSFSRVLCDFRAFSPRCCYAQGFEGSEHRSMTGRDGLGWHCFWARDAQSRSGDLPKSLNWFTKSTETVGMQKSMLRIRDCIGLSAITALIVSSALASAAARATWQPQPCCTACFGFRWRCKALILSRSC